MKVVKIGTIKGRHPMPVDAYIFTRDIQNPMDILSIEVDTLLCTEYALYECGINPDKCKDVEVHLYVTGLTTVTIAALKVLKKMGLKVVAMHYNRDTDDYVSQEVF